MDVYQVFNSRCIFVIYLFAYLAIVKGSEVNLLNTATATSDLKGWLIKTYVHGVDGGNSTNHGWEELSFNHLNKTERGFQVCPERNVPQAKTQSWLRSPFLNVKGIFRLYIELNFWMRECHDLKNTVCRETFKVYYMMAKNRSDENNKALLNDSNYTTIDTIAAETKFFPSTNLHLLKTNKETVSLTLGDGDYSLNGNESNRKNGVYIAVIDEGACMALTSVRIYYKVCPQSVFHLAYFPKTHTGLHDTSLVQVKGHCVSNSVIVSSHMLLDEKYPLYHCTSSGEWKVRTGSCQCILGYEPDDLHHVCVKCSMNYYKSSTGNEKCTACPADTYTLGPGSSHCQCTGNNSISTGNSNKHSNVTSGQDCQACSELPSAPTNLTLATKLNQGLGVIRLGWGMPTNLGRCSKVIYCAICQFCSSQENASATIHGSSFSNDCNTIQNHSLDQSINQKDIGYGCADIVFFPHQCNHQDRFVTVANLKNKIQYKFTVIAVSKVTLKQFEKVFQNVDFHPYLTMTSRIQLANSPVVKDQLETLCRNSGSSIVYSRNDGVPAAVTNLHVVAIGQSSATVAWSSLSATDETYLTYQVKWYPAHSYQSPDYRKLHIDEYASSQTVNESSAVLVGLVPEVNYEVVVRAQTRTGMGNFSEPILFRMSSLTSPFTPEPPFTAMYGYILGPLIVLFMIIIIVAIFLKYPNSFSMDKFSRSHISGEQTQSTDVPTQYSDVPAEQRTYVDPFLLDNIFPTFKCETLPELVNVTSVIGCGEFGEVYQGTLTRKGLNGVIVDRVIDVAVKQLHANCQPHEQLDFLREAMSLEAFKHPNIVRLEAVVTASRPFMIVTELMKHGCLGAFLRNHQKAGHAFQPIVLIEMLQGVASGMAYLSRINYIHRDLAARNVLINEDLVCKVADFGLTRHVGEFNVETTSNQTYTSYGGKMAIRWTAPEAVAYGTYSHASDVWSFGVFAWEVVTYGEKPYWNLTNQQVLQALNEGFRLPAPSDCPSVLHQLMLECWHCDRQTRPTFLQVLSKIDHMINNTDLLKTLASPASTGAEEMFFVETPPHTPVPVPTVSNGQAYHKYATCQIDDDSYSRVTSSSFRCKPSRSCSLKQNRKFHHSSCEARLDVSLLTSQPSSVVIEGASECTPMLERPRSSILHDETFSVTDRTSSDNDHLTNSATSMV